MGFPFVLAHLRALASLSSLRDLGRMVDTANPPMNRWAEFLQPRKAGRSLAKMIVAFLFVVYAFPGTAHLVGAKGRAKGIRD